MKSQTITLPRYMVEKQPDGTFSLWDTVEYEYTDHEFETKDAAVQKCNELNLKSK